MAKQRYAWRGVDRQGQVVTGKTHAAGKDEVAVLLREQRASLETLKQQLLVLRRLERAGARPGGSDQSDLQAAGADQATQDAFLTSSLQSSWPS